MINGNDRLIIVTGMPYSGTTVLTFLLQKHRDVTLCRAGRGQHLLEHQALQEMSTEGIRQILHDHPAGRVLIKSPFSAYWPVDWLTGEMPDAYYINCLKSHEEWWASCEARLREGKIGDADSRWYELALVSATLFGDRVQRFRTVRHSTLLHDPAGTMASLFEWLGLAPQDIDVSVVSKEPAKSIRRLLQQRSIGLV
jgi:hypothetical protein